MKLSVSDESNESKVMAGDEREIESDSLASCQSKYRALQRRLLLLKSYLNEDPGIVYYDIEWGNLADKALLLWQQLQSINGRAQSQLLLLSAEDKLKLEDMLQEVSPFLSSHYDAILNEIEGDEVGSRVPLIHLHADPLFQMYQDRFGQFKSDFNQLNKRAVASTVKEISDYSRYLFLNMPRDEMLNPKSSECPRYLANAAFFNDINVYTVNDILQFESVNARAAAYSHWVAVAKGLYEVGDFSSAKSIYVALISNVALTRLAHSMTGVSSTDRRQLERLGLNLKKEALYRQYQQRNSNVIPFMGHYRSDLERIKQIASLTKDSGSEQEQRRRERQSEKAKVKLADTLVGFQRAVSIEVTHELPRTDIAGCGRRIAMDCDLDPSISDKSVSKFVLTRFNTLSNQYEPRGVQRLPSRLLSYKKQSWLNGLRNRVLANVVLNKKITPLNGVGIEGLRSLNEVVRVRVSRKRFRRRLRRVGIELDRATLKRVHLENKQLYYHNLIGNSALKNIVRGRTFLNSSWVFSTSRIVRRVNRCLNGPVKKKELIRLLRTVNIDLTTAELTSVIQEARLKRLSSPNVVHLERTFQELQELLGALSHDAGLNKQLRDYMKIVSVDSLSDFEKRQCLLNLTSVVAGSGFQHSGFNPDLERIRRLVKLQEQIGVLSSYLSDSTADQSLAQKIQVIKHKINAHPLFKQYCILERWCSAGGEPDASLRRDIVRSAKLGRRVRAKLKNKGYLNQVIMRARRRTQEQLEPKLASRLVGSFKGMLLPVEENFLSCMKNNTLSPEIYQQLLSCVAAVKAVSSVQDIEDVKRQYASVEARLGSRVSEIKKAFDAYQEALSYVAKEFQLNRSLLKYTREEPKRNLDSSTIEQLQALGFLTKMKRNFILGIEKTRSSDFVAKFPGVDPRPFSMVKIFSDLRVSIEKLQAPVVELSREEQLPTLDNEASLFREQQAPGSLTVLEETAVAAARDSLNRVSSHAEQKDAHDTFGYQCEEEGHVLEAVVSQSEIRGQAMIRAQTVSDRCEDSTGGLLNSAAQEADSVSDGAALVEGRDLQKQDNRLGHKVGARMNESQVLLPPQPKSVLRDNQVVSGSQQAGAFVVNMKSKAPHAKPRYSYVEYGAAVVGALVLAPVAVKVAGFALLGAAVKTAIAAKFTAGVVGVGAGMRLGVEVEHAAEKSVSRALGCLGVFAPSSKSKDSCEPGDQSSFNMK